MEEEEVTNEVKKKISKKIISKNTKEQTIVIKAEVCDHRLKILILNILIIIVCILIIYKLFIKPYFFHSKQKNISHFHQVLIKYYNKYTSMDNIFLFIIFCFIVAIFLTFNVIELQNIGIILIITFFTAIAQEGEEFLLGAVLSGITAYLFIRLKTYFSSSNHKLDECGVNNWEYLKHQWKKLFSK